MKIKYFKTKGFRDWVFAATENKEDGTTREVILLKESDTPIKRPGENRAEGTFAAIALGTEETTSRSGAHRACVDSPAGAENSTTKSLPCAANAQAARFDLAAALFECFLRRVATCLGNFVVSAGLCLRQISSLSLVTCLSRGL